MLTHLIYLVHIVFTLTTCSKFSHFDLVLFALHPVKVFLVKFLRVVQLLLDQSISSTLYRVEYYKSTISRKSISFPSWFVSKRSHCFCFRGNLINKQTVIKPTILNLFRAYLFVCYERICHWRISCSAYFKYNIVYSQFLVIITKLKKWNQIRLGEKEGNLMSITIA